MGQALNCATSHKVKGTGVVVKMLEEGCTYSIRITVKLHVYSQVRGIDALGLNKNIIADRKAGVLIYYLEIR